MNIERIANENVRRREKFSKMLRDYAPIDNIRAEAVDYFNGKIEETMEIIDYAFGPELQIACEMQDRYKRKLAAVKAAQTSMEIVMIVG